MKLIINFLKSMLSSMSYIIPISNRTLVFSSFPDYTDNAYAFYKYLLKAKKDRSYIFIWLLSDKTNLNLKIDSITKENSKAKVYYRFSLMGLWYFFRAKKIFCTHGLNSFISLKQNNKIVNLWHGMPLKLIGSMEPRNNGFNPTKADYLIASSSSFQQVMSKSFNEFNKSRIFIIGQPRNDLMYEKTDFYTANKIPKDLYRKIGIWVPTYRSSIISEIRIDGKYEIGKISFLSSNELLTLNSVLNSNSDLLIIKLHPMDALQDYPFPDFSNIIIIKQNSFQTQLYPLLGSTDYLLTDYSSVWIDYEILGKPIGFVMNDYEEFKISRGFTIENLDKKLPGTLIGNFIGLINFVSNPKKTKDNESDLFNLYKDGNASERLANILKL